VENDKKDMPKKDKQHMHIDVETLFYKRIKRAAINRGMTIARYVLGCVGDQVEKDEKYIK
jgi:hypothetical protein